jgi:tetratricopeptide (TPR) repeat protein
MLATRAPRLPPWTAVVCLVTFAVARAIAGEPGRFAVSLEGMELADVERLVKNAWHFDEGYARVHHTPLMVAAEAGRADIVALLLSKRADANRVDDRAGAADQPDGTPSYCTPLYFAAHGARDEVSVLEALLAAGARIEGDPRCERSPLNEAISRAKLASVRFLLSKGANPNAMARNGAIPLVEAAQAREAKARLPLIETLLGAGAAIDGRDVRGGTALERAVDLKQRALSDLLIAKGADPRITDVYGYTALTWAPEGSFRKSVEAAAARMKRPVPAPVFFEWKGVSTSNWGSLGAFWIGKDARVGVMNNDTFRVVDPAGNERAVLPQSPVRLCAEPVAELLDLDGDGVRDVSFVGKECESASTFLLHMSLRGGQTNFFVNCDTANDRLTGPAPLPPALRGVVAALLERRLGLGHDRVERLLASYALMLDPSNLAYLEQDHQQALRAYKAHQPAKAASLLEDDFALPVLGQTDPSGTDPKVTAMLNDYGFFLTEAGKHEQAVVVLQRVLARAPNRAVAYLNLADAEYARGDRTGARGHYRRYATLMQEVGKSDKVPARVAERSAP